MKQDARYAEADETVCDETPNSPVGPGHGEGDCAAHHHAGPLGLRDDAEVHMLGKPSTLGGSERSEKPGPCDDAEYRNHAVIPVKVSGERSQRHRDERDREAQQETEPVHGRPVIRTCARLLHEGLRGAERRERFEQTGHERRHRQQAEIDWSH